MILNNWKPEPAALSRRRLRDEVATVINCAGETVFFPEYPDRFRAGHVEGPLGLLEWLAEGRLTTWAQVSTAYVCGRRTDKSRISRRISFSFLGMARYCPLSLLACSRLCGPRFATAPRFTT